VLKQEIVIDFVKEGWDINDGTSIDCKKAAVYRKD
jgi:hypothetical protein